jgi:VTC domain
MMNQDFYKDEIQAITSQFEPITLEEMAGVSLMNRVDRKFMIPIYLLPHILEAAKSFYKILEINQLRMSAYESMYFDTPDLELYNHHQSGRSNRYKIRLRKYLDSSLAFLEIKHKNNKGRTIKKRIEVKLEEVKYLNTNDFLQKTTPYSWQQIEENMNVNYHRITLVNKTNPERLTIDINLKFEGNNKEKSFPEIAIAEIKQEQMGASPISDIFKKYQIRQGSISKYCLGVISTNPSVKHNRFKTKYLRLQKIINQHDLFTNPHNTLSEHSLEHSMA